VLDVKLRVHGNRLSIKLLCLRYHRTFSQTTFILTNVGPVYYRYVLVTFSVHTPEAYVASSTLAATRSIHYYACFRRVNNVYWFVHVVETQSVVTAGSSLYM
jgi:hypothetical protein